MKSEPFTEIPLSVDLPKLTTITTQREDSNSLRDAQHITLKSIPLTNHSHTDIPSLTTIYLPTAFKNTQFITSSSTPLLLFSQIDISNAMSQLLSDKQSLLCFKKEKEECNSRESNPGLIRGRDLSYHLTTIALFWVFILPLSHTASPSFRPILHSLYSFTFTRTQPHISTLFFQMSVDLSNVPPSLPIEL